MDIWEERDKTVAGLKLKTVKKVPVKMSKPMDIIHSGVLTPVIAISLCNFFFNIYTHYVKLKLLYWAPASHTLKP